MSRAVLVLLAIFLSNCGDGTVQPIRADTSNVGGSPSGGTGGSLSGGTGGSGSNVSADCAISDWPEAELEDEMLTELNAWRAEGASCGGNLGDSLLPLTESPQLRCEARVHSMTAFTASILTSPATTVTLLSAPPAYLDVPTFLQQVIEDGWVGCNSLLSPEFTIVGIGYSTDEIWGYWTIYLSGV